MALAQLTEIADAQRTSAAASLRGANIATALTLLAVAIATRAVYIGDPALGGDEGLYLLVGDRMWHGALPYVDIWDRKPIGLFLLFAAFRPFSSDGVVAYQVAALLFASGTAYVIAKIASRFVWRPAATMGGCIYLIYLPIIGGAGGQAPVFYNLFMALAALAILKAQDQKDKRIAFRLTLGAMLIVGIAIEVKTSCAIEGMFFGIWLVANRWRTDRNLLRMLGSAAAWIAAAAVPTLLVIAFYVLKGHGAALYYAYVTSALMKQEPQGFSELCFVRESAVKMATILAVAMVGAVRIVRQKRCNDQALFILLWSAVTIYGFFSIGHYYAHYAQPALIPLSVLCAVMMEQAVEMGFVLLLVMVCNWGLTGFPHPRHIDQDKALTAAFTENLRPYARSGCIYLGAGPLTVYIQTDACLVTPFVFPEHLGIAAEARTTGGAAAMSALIAHRPAAIVFPDEANLAAYHRPRNVANDAIMSAALASQYHLEALIADPYVKGHFQVFVRNDLR